MTNHPLRPINYQSIIHKYRRINKTNEILIQVNQLMVTANDESQLIQDICDIIVEKGHFKLAYIAIPDVQGKFQFLGSTGEQGYMQNLFISVDSDIPEGKGSLGTGFREDRAIYNQTFQTIPHLLPWKARAIQFGFHSSASLPIHRGGKKWGMLSIYHEQEHVFDEDMRSLIETLAIDITNGLDRIDLINAERRLLEVQHHFFERTSVGMALIQNHSIVMVNHRLAVILGYASVNELMGQPVTLICPNYYADQKQQIFNEWQQRGFGSESGLTITTKNGRQKWVDLSISWLKELSDHQMTSSIWTIQDMTGHFQLEQQLEYAAMHDSLTSLPNRRSFEQHLHHTISQAKQDHSSFLLGIFDLDNFKYVNDTFGHEAGDHLLKTLTHKFQDKLRPGDFLARWGGDELVILLHPVPPNIHEFDLEELLSKLHRAIEDPIEIVTNQWITITISMGLALYPEHGEEEDHLIRTADIAMYQMKSHQWSRKRWWQLGVAEEWKKEVSHSQLLFPSQLLTDQFFVKLFHQEASRSIINNLSEEEYAEYKEHATQHVDYLFHTEDSIEKIREHSLRIGKINALMGISGELLSQAAEFYSQQVTQFATRYPIASYQEIVSSIQHRLQIDLQTQLQAQENMMTEYLTVFNQILSARHNGDLTALAHLPGIIGILRFKLHPQDGFIVEEALGHRGQEIAIALTAPGIKAVPNSSDLKGQSLLAESWFTSTILSTPSYLKDARFTIWHDTFQKLGIHSLLMVPILDANRNTVKQLGIYGALAHQFESAWMKAFALGVQLYGQERWGQSQITSHISKIDVGKYRSHLFNDGLLFYMQPIVNLQTGKILKYEILARIQMGNGNILTPATFLPFLGVAEIDRLFQFGMEKGIQSLTKWGDFAEHAGLSINLSPSTLYNKEIIPWIQETLFRYHFSPDRIYLELLETQGFDLDNLVKPLEQLVEMGIHLAMDDFGAGDSNFLRLVVHPFQIVKFDRGLWAPLTDHPLSTLKLIGSLIEIGNDFGWKIIIEGIETFEMAEAVLQLGAEYGQGYYFAKPMPMDQVVNWTEQFTYTLTRDTIQTLLGAIAYLTRRLRQNRKSMQSEEQCPITHFFREKGWEDTEGMTIHHQIHQETYDPILYRRLLEWLENTIIHL